MFASYKCIQRIKGSWRQLHYCYTNLLTYLLTYLRRRQLWEYISPGEYQLGNLLQCVTSVLFYRSRKTEMMVLGMIMHQKRLLVGIHLWRLTGNVLTVLVDSLFLISYSYISFGIWTNESASVACSNVRLWKLDTQKEWRNTSWRLWGWKGWERLRRIRGQQRKQPTFKRIDRLTRSNNHLTASA